MIRSSKFVPAFFSGLLALGIVTTASAQQPGITDTEIKFGNIMPYSAAQSEFPAEEPEHLLDGLWRLKLNQWSALRCS